MESLHLKRYTEAPETGWVLACTRKSVILNHYGCGEERDKIVVQSVKDDLLELHLFNNQKEYRCLKTLSARFPSGWIETVADFLDEPGQVYSEKVRLIEPWQDYSMKVLNHIFYDDESGLCHIDNYRLCVADETERGL